MRKFKALRFISLLLIFMTLASIVNPYYVQATGLETPSISNPDNGEDYSIGDMKVNWQNCENADYYTVSLRDLTRDKLLIDMKKTTKSNYTISANNFTAGHQYRIAVGAFGNGSEAWDEAEFSIKNDEVEKPEISNPNEGDICEALDVKVDWQNCENADYYTVSLRDVTEDSLLIDKDSITSSKYTISARYFMAGHQYRVAVGAFGNGSEEWDEVQFSIKDVPTPVVETPEISNPNEGTAYEAVNMKVDYTDDLRYVWRSIWIRIKVMVGEGTWSCMSN